ncbi:unnamed protein product [Cuscuta campestris]|uniref:Protein kinase domain-containing protein n=1 Tax=Cuscuta campestris TaxID=132261 RepID=A0A484MM69_9ASTE|nr:unnamed protein product [Cuscuta campestris]
MKMWTYLRLAAINFKVILDPNQGPMVQSRNFIAHSLEDLLNLLPCKIQEDSNAILVPIPLREAIASLEDMVHQTIHEPTMEVVIQNEFNIIAEHLGEEKFLFHIEDESLPTVEDAKLISCALIIRRILRTSKLHCMLSYNPWLLVYVDHFINIYMLKPLAHHSYEAMVNYMDDHVHETLDSGGSAFVNVVNVGPGNAFDLSEGLYVFKRAKQDYYTDLRGEAIVMSYLRYPCLPRLFCFAEHNEESIVLVMEYVKGYTLQNIMNAGSNQEHSHKSDEEDEEK